MFNIVGGGGGGVTIQNLKILITNTTTRISADIKLIFSIKISMQT